MDLENFEDRLDNAIGFGTSGQRLADYINSMASHVLIYEASPLSTSEAEMRRKRRNQEMEKTQARRSVDPSSLRKKEDIFKDVKDRRSRELEAAAGRDVKNVKMPEKRDERRSSDADQERITQEEDARRKQEQEELRRQQREARAQKQKEAVEKFFIDLGKTGLNVAKASAKGLGKVLGRMAADILDPEKKGERISGWRKSLANLLRDLPESSRKKVLQKLEAEKQQQNKQSQHRGEQGPVRTGAVKLKATPNSIKNYVVKSVAERFGVKPVQDTAAESIHTALKSIDNLLFESYRVLFEQQENMNAIQLEGNGKKMTLYIGDKTLRLDVEEPEVEGDFTVDWNPGTITGNNKDEVRKKLSNYIKAKIKGLVEQVDKAIESHASGENLEELKKAVEGELKDQNFDMDSFLNKNRDAIASNSNALKFLLKRGHAKKDGDQVSYEDSVQRMGDYWKVDDFPGEGYVRVLPTNMKFAFVDVYLEGNNVILKRRFKTSGGYQDVGDVKIPKSDFGIRFADEIGKLEASYLGAIIGQAPAKADIETDEEEEPEVETEPGAEVKMDVGSGKSFVKDRRVAQDSDVDELDDIDDEDEDDDIEGERDDDVSDFMDSHEEGVYSDDDEDEEDMEGFQIRAPGEEAPTDEDDYEDEEEESEPEPEPESDKKSSAWKRLISRVMQGENARERKAILKRVAEQAVRTDIGEKVSAMMDRHSEKGLKITTDDLKSLANSIGAPGHEVIIEMLRSIVRMIRNNKRKKQSVFADSTGNDGDVLIENSEIKSIIESIEIRDFPIILEQDDTIKVRVERPDREPKYLTLSELLSLSIPEPVIRRSIGELAGNLIDSGIVSTPKEFYNYLLDNGGLRSKGPTVVNRLAGVINRWSYRWFEDEEEEQDLENMWGKPAPLPWGDDVNEPPEESDWPEDIETGERYAPKERPKPIDYARKPTHAPVQGEIEPADLPDQPGRPARGQPVRRAQPANDDAMAFLDDIMSQEEESGIDIEDFFDSVGVQNIEAPPAKAPPAKAPPAKAPPAKTPPAKPRVNIEDDDELSNILADLFSSEPAEKVAAEPAPSIEKISSKSKIPMAKLTKPDTTGDDDDLDSILNYLEQLKK